MNARPSEQMASIDRHESVKEYYGRILASSRDLQTTACCASDHVPAWLRTLINEVHPEVRDRFYGCGSPIPLALEGCTVLDLGCGTGRDCFVLSRLVGASGRVLGVDMTEAQLELARRHVDWHAKRSGFAMPNIEFRHGYIEDLAALGLAEGSVDVVVSNCVINLSPDKRRVFSEIWRVLKPGGELYFSDVFCDRRLPAALARDPVLVGECLGGALYVEDFRRLMSGIGFADVRLVTRSPVAVTADRLTEVLGNARFESRTVRAFKLDLEDRCEDYGQVAIYRGTVPHATAAFTLDGHHVFESARPLAVCGNTVDMLEQTRYARLFDVLGDRSRHHGLFSCEPRRDADANPTDGPACC